jgi:FkbM family methyltransferase
MVKLQLVCLRLHHLCLNYLDKDSVVVDLGANRGYFSHEIYDLIGCECYAVEASPELFESIESSDRIHKFNYAIAAENKTLKFNLSTNEESGSIKDLPDRLTDTNTVEIQGITLDHFLQENNIEKVDLLKVDIEGAEIEMFKSVSDETLQKIGQIAVEFHDFLDYFDMRDDVKFLEKRFEELGFYSISFSIFSHADMLLINPAKTGMTKGDYLYLNYFAKYRRAVVRGISWRIRKLRERLQSKGQPNPKPSH